MIICHYKKFKVHFHTDLNYSVVHLMSIYCLRELNDHAIIIDLAKNDQQFHLCPSRIMNKRPPSRAAAFRQSRPCTFVICIRSRQLGRPKNNSRLLTTLCDRRAEQSGKYKRHGGKIRLEGSLRTRSSRRR